MCKYVIVITVIVRQDVDGHFGSTLNLPAVLLCTYYVCQYTHKPINQLLPIISGVAKPGQARALPGHQTSLPHHQLLE